MSAPDSSNTHEVIGALFRAMNTKIEERFAANLPRWANVFPYVNGGLFSGSMQVTRFSRIARSYLLHIGNLDWKKINPDIFGSMIQAVAEDEERGALGMHYTSVPNILKVLNPLFLDDLREKLDEAGDNPRKLLNLRNRMSKIRVFDPACGSGNFLVIAYKEMRAIEHKINKATDREEILALRKNPAAAMLLSLLRVSHPIPDAEFAIDQIETAAVLGWSRNKLRPAIDALLASGRLRRIRRGGRGVAHLYQLVRSTL
jgi:hypothetical protein